MLPGCLAGCFPVNRCEIQTAKNIVKKPMPRKPASMVFAVPRSKATALNDLPVNIVIDPIIRAIPVKTGTGDLIVVASGLRMRSEPSSRSNSLGNYSKGARFAHIRDENGWALVQSLDDGQKGWMFKKYMGKAS